MPLRRSLPLAALAVCLCGGLAGLALPLRGATRLGPPPTAVADLPSSPAARAPLSPDAVGYLAAARPYMLDPASLPDAGFPAEGAVELYHLRYEQVLANGLSALVVQRVFQIRTADAAAFFALDDLWYDSSRTSFQLIAADVLRGGRALPGRDDGNLRPGGTGNQPRRVTLPRLRAGDRVNVLYILLPDQTHDWSLLDGHFLGNLFAFRDAFSSTRVDYVLAGPQPLTISQVGLPAPRRAQGPAGPAAYTWRWEMANQPAFFSQVNGPSLTDRSPFVQVSGFKNWGELEQWYGSLLAQRADLPAALQQRLLALATAPAAPHAASEAAAAPLVAAEAPSASPAAGEASFDALGAGGPVDKTTAAAPVAAPADPAARARDTVNRVWGYLSGHLDYRADETGIHAYVPAQIAQVLQAQRGDCKDGALLLAAWLRAAGVDADLALVRTSAMGQLAPAGPDGSVAATMAAFDHALVYIPATRQWIDTTAPGFLDSELPSSDQNSLALIVRPGQDQLVRIPVAAPEANLTRRSIDLTPAADGWLRAEGTIAVRGADAPDLRRRYANPQGREAQLRAWLAPYFPQAKVESVAVAGVTPSADTVEVRFVAQIHGPASAADSSDAPSYAAAWMPRHYAAALAAQAVRSDDLRLPLRWALDETWTLHLPHPDDCSLYLPDPGQHRQSAFGQLDIETACQAGALVVHSYVTQAAVQVGVGDYSRFRGFWESVDSQLNAPVPTPGEQIQKRIAATEAALASSVK